MFKRGLLFSLAFLCLSACTFRPDLISASVREIGPTQGIVEVIINSNDAKRLKAGEFYFSVVATECDEGSNRFPMEPLIGGKRVAEFDFSIPEGQTTVTSYIPAQILSRYRMPCVYLEGGGYFSGRVRSEAVQLLVAQQGTNRDFERD